MKNHRISIIFGVLFVMAAVCITGCRKTSESISENGKEIALHGAEIEPVVSEGIEGSYETYTASTNTGATTVTAVLNGDETKTDKWLKLNTDIHILPDRKSPVITTMKKGDLVQVFALSDNNYYMFSYEGRVAYIAAERLTDKNPQTNLPDASVQNKPTQNTQKAKRPETNLQAADREQQNTDTNQADVQTPSKPAEKPKQDTTKTETTKPNNTKQDNTKPDTSKPETQKPETQTTPQAPVDISMENSSDEAANTDNNNSVNDNDNASTQE